MRSKSNTGTKGDGSGSRKRTEDCLDDDEPVLDINTEMKHILDSFGADVSKTLSAKKRRLEQYTQNSMKTSQKKVEDVFKSQVSERKNLLNEFEAQLDTLVNQWDSDLDHAKVQEEKLQKILGQLQKYHQQNRIAQANRIKAIKKLHEQYAQGLQELEKCHEEQQGGISSEIKKEMAALQKKILSDTQQQKMADMRKSLQTMLM